MLASRASQPSLKTLLQAMLLGSASPAAFFDRQDLSTMYQDSAGTTPCAVGSPVGLALDKSKGLVRGPEMVVNGGFDSAAGWTPGTAWAVSGGAAVATAAASGDVLLQDRTGLISSGKAYEVAYTVSSYTAGIVAVKVGGTIGTQRSSAGTFREVIFAGAGALFEIQSRAAGTTLAVDNLSIRELPGNHATQGTSASRPDLLQDASGRFYAAWDGVDASMASAAGGGTTSGFFFCAALTVSGGAATPRTIWSDTGANTGRLVRINAANKFQFIAGNGAAFTFLETAATFAVGETHVVTAWDDGTNMNVQLDQGAIASVARPAVSAGSAGFTLGKSNLAASEFFLGRDYGAVYLGAAPSADLIALAKRVMAAEANLPL